MDDGDFEVILVDDGTLDDSFARIADIVAQHANVTIHRPANQGISVARNTGLQKAAGEYVLFIDSDDLLVPHSLLPLLNDACTEMPDILYAEFVKLSDAQIPNYHIEQTAYRSTAESAHQLFVHHFNPRECFVWRALYRRQFLMDCGLRFIPGIYFEDVPFTVECYLKAGKCHELLYWDQNTKFCGVCGGPMRFDTAISKKCEHCGKEIWPQLATAVIVRIRRQETTREADGTTIRKDEILLVHAKNFRGDHYGLVAGFVETGETLEEAVYREVLEETGLHITNLRYFGSQPWPYPCGLMVGFTADYDFGKIHLQRSELTKGAWFDRDHLPAIPEKMSIARQLIDAWLEE